MRARAKGRARVSERLLGTLLMKFNGGESAAIKARAHQSGAFIVKLQIKIEASSERRGLTE